jgi:hypothetical protein
MNIIETSYELSDFTQSIVGKVSYWFPMWVDNDKHPLNTHISFVFVRCEGNDYILPKQHTDALSLSSEQIEAALNTDGEKWVFQKKKLLQSLPNIHQPSLDVDSSYFLKTAQTIDYRTPFQSYLTKWTHKGYYDNLIQSIPLLKLGEIVQSFITQFISLDTTNHNFNWYNNTYIPILSAIEEFGIRVDREKFSDRWPSSPKHLTPSDIIYTEYNPFTITGRPSNRHGGINFSALNKSDGSRASFISDGVFLQMDYDSYHPRLIGKLIGFELPKTSVHQWLAQQYGCDVNEGKGITFQLLYGGIDDDFRQIPYFDKVADYIITLWDKTQKDGYLSTRYRRIPLSWIEQPNPQKVFNYLLQAVETELNVDILGKILDYIKGSGIKLSLYTYDSFLFDIPTDVDKGLVAGLKAIIEGSGFPIKASWGLDYEKV